MQVIRFPLYVFVELATPSVRVFISFIHPIMHAMSAGLTSSVRLTRFHGRDGACPQETYPESFDRWEGSGKLSFWGQNHEKTRFLVKTSKIMS